LLSLFPLLFPAKTDRGLSPPFLAHPALEKAPPPIPNFFLLDFGFSFTTNVSLDFSSPQMFLFSFVCFGILHPDLSVPLKKSASAQNVFSCCNYRLKMSFGWKVFPALSTLQPVCVCNTETHFPRSTSPGPLQFSNALPSERPPRVSRPFPSLSRSKLPSPLLSFSRLSVRLLTLLFACCQPTWTRFLRSSSALRIPPLPFPIYYPRPFLIQPTLRLGIHYYETPGNLRFFSR